MIIKKFLLTIYIIFLLFLVYLSITFTYEALDTQYAYTCGTWTRFCPYIKGWYAVLANIHLTTLEIRLAVTLLALAIMIWIGFKYAK